MLLFVNWNVNPEIFSLGPFSVRWYGLLFAAGFLIGYYILEKMFRSEGVNEKWLDNLFIYVIIATVVGARLGHVFFYGWDYYSHNLSEIYKVWHGGLASHGGAIGILIAIWIFSKVVTKRSMLWTLDRLVVPVALVAAFIRTGNLMNSEIYGIETTMPWGFIFERNGETLAKHPTQIYEALCYLATFILLHNLYYKDDVLKNRPGFLFGVFLTCIFGFRFLIEFIKENQEPFEETMSLNMGQVLSIPFILAGIILIVVALNRAPKIYKN